MSRAAPLVLAIALGLGFSTALSAPVTLTGPVKPRQVELANDGLYIVTFAEAPLAIYRGGVVDAKSSRMLAATTPSVTGARKLDAHSVESTQYLGFLKDRRGTHLQDASALLGRPLAPAFVYDVLRNGVALALSPAEAARLRQMPGVSSVVADYKRHVTTDAGPQWIHADQVWSGAATAPAPGTRGAGVVIGVVDTGVNNTHPAFSGTGISNPRGHFYGLCVSNASLCTNKLIGMYDFTTGTGDLEANDGLDHVGHGSHTASTAAGAPVDYSIPLPSGAQIRHTQGVANGANLITYKACEVGGCNGVWLNAALNQAATDGVDVINFSIGGSLDDPWSVQETDAQDMLNARAAGIVVVVAAGNDGPNPGSLTAPSNAPWVLSVAAATHNRIFANKLDLTGGGTAPPNGGQLIGAAMTGGVGPLPLVLANPALCDEGSNTTGTAGENKPAAWTSTTYSNKMVVCNRGIYPRVSKSENVSLAGGGGMVLVNQASDGESIVADSHVIPSTHLGYTEGQALLTWLASGTGQMGTLEGTVITTLDSQGDLLAGFSGRGPASIPAGVLKPDVSAPGVDILAASNVGSGYNIYSGTSMATPHTAGAAALMKAAHPTWGPSEIISALTTTARPSVRIDTTHLGTPFDQGGGMLDLAKAVRAGLSFDVSRANFDAANPSLTPTPGVPHDLNLPSLVQENCFEQCHLTRTVRDLVGGASWQVSTNVPGAVITPDTSNFTLGANGTQTIYFGIDVRIASSVGHWVYGTVTMHPTTGVNIPDTVLPVAIFVSAGAAQAPVVLNVPSESGFSDIGISGLVALPDAGFAGTPLVPVVTQSATVAQDPTSADPFDNLALGVTYTLFTVPEAPDHSARTYKVTVHATADPTISDIDLYVGQDTNGNGLPDKTETTCTSAGPTADETCAFDVVNPGGGSGPITYWALAQNYSGPTGTLHIETVVAPIVADNNTLTVTGPGQLPHLTAATLRVIWNDPSMVTGSSRAGYVIVSATPGSQSLLIPVRINRTGTTAAAFALQNSVPHTLTLAANTAQDRIYFDVPVNATQVVFTTQGSSGQISLYAAHVDNPPGPVIAPAPARNLAQAVSSNAGPNQTITLNGAAVLPGRWYVTAVNTSSIGAPVVSTVTATVTQGSTPIPFVGTAFYDPNRSGAGIYINPDGVNGYPELDWYTYLEDGTPVWYLADTYRVSDTGNAGQIWGDLKRVTMGSSGKMLTKVGTIAISLIDANHLVYSYNLNGQSGSSSMLLLGTHTCPTLSGSNSTTTGLWYPPAHDGIGESLIVNNHDEYYAIYVYDATGNPRWAYAEQPLDTPPQALAARTLTAYQLAGSCPQCTWAASSSTAIGSFTRNLIQGGISSIGINFNFVSPLAGSWNETHPVVRLSMTYACPVLYTISGTVSGAVQQNVAVNLAGTASASTTTDVNGNYSFPGLANGSYTITPSLTGYTFSPTSTAVTLSGADSTANNFTSSSGGSSGSFAMTAPAQGSASVSTTPTLTWGSSAGAVSYTVEIATTATFGASDVANITGLSTTSYAVTTPLTPGVIYYWRAIAVNGSGTTLASNAPLWFSSPLSAGSKASGVAVTPDGTRALVTNSNSSGTVTVVSLVTHTVLATIPVGAYPSGIAITADGSKAVVANSIGHSISVIDLSSNTVTSTIPTPCVGSTLYDIAVTPDGTRAVLGDLSSGCTQSGLDVVSIASGAIAFVNFGSYNGPFGVAVTPDGSSVLTTNGILGTSIKRMNLATNALTTISGTSASFGVAVTPDGTTALLASGGGDTVKVISLASNTVTATIPYGSNQNTHNVAITADGSKAVVVGDFDVAILSLANNTVLATYPDGGGSVAITPDGKTALITDSTNGALKFVRIQ